MRHSTDAWYRLPDGENRERQSLPVIVLFSVARCPQDTTFFPPGYFSFISFFLTPSRPMTREMTPPQKNTAHRKEREREREKRCPGQAALRKGKDRTGGHQSTLRHTQTHTEPVLFLGTGTYLKKLSQDGNTIPMLLFLTTHAKYLTSSL